MAELFKPHLKALRIWRAFHESKWTLAGAIVFRPDGRLLLLRSRQRRAWEYPAGAVDGAESPLEGCRREVAEETGLRLEEFQFIGVDYFLRPGAPNGALFFTFAATVTEEQAEAVKIQVLEATDYRWVTRNEAHELIESRLKNRFAELLNAYDQQRSIIMHNGGLQD